MNQSQENLVNIRCPQDDFTILSQESRREIKIQLEMVQPYNKITSNIAREKDDLLNRLPTIKLQTDSIKILSETSILLNKITIQAEKLIVHFSLNELNLQKSTQILDLINIGKLQISQIIEIFFVDKSSQVFNDRNTSLGKFAVPLKESKEINQMHIKTFLEFLNSRILIPLFEINDNFFKKECKLKPKVLIQEMKIYLSKLYTMLEIFPFVIKHDQQDLFSFDENDDKWLKIKEHVQTKILGTEQNLKISYDQILRGILLGNAIISKQGQYKNKIMKSLVMGAGAIYYLLNEQESLKQARIFQAEPQVDLAIKVWNMLDNGIVKQMLPVLFPAIVYKEKIFIPRYFKNINIDYIFAQYEQGSINKIRDEDSNFILPNIEMLEAKDLFKPTKSESRVCIRILSSQKIKLLTDNIGEQDISQTHNEIIIHIHGGGFVSMTSRSHQTYTRKWANSLGVPVFSIDYRLAPQDPFPAALDDVWQAYCWIVNFTPYYFKNDIIPRKVVLVGDSAGGNLVAALTILIIKEKARIPEGILLAYPALNLDRNFYTPSMLWSIDDAMLPHTYLKMCIESYVQNSILKPDSDPLISPSKASDEILDQFPPCRIQAGKNDPLHDESWRLAQRLIERKRNFKMLIYPGMPHAFYSFDTPQGMREAAVTIQDATYYLKELLEGNFTQ